MTKGIVYRFNLGDVEDPVVYAAEPLSTWEKSEMGQWVIQNSVSPPGWYISTNYNTFGYNVYVVANLSEDDWTYFHLKYGHLIFNNF